MRRFQRPQATCHEPRIAFSTPRTRQAGSAEIRGPCRTNRQDSVAAVPFATSYAALRAIPLSSPRATYSQGGHTGPPLRRDDTHHESRATTTGHMPLLPIPRTRWLCRPISGAHAGIEADVLLSLTRKHWNVGEGFKPSPTGYEPKTELGVSTGHRTRATGHRITTHHELRTTYTQGGHTGPPLQRDDPYHEQRAATTGNEPQGTCRFSSFQPSEPLARANWNQDRCSFHRS